MHRRHIQSVLAFLIVVLFSHQTVAKVDSLKRLLLNCGDSIQKAELLYQIADEHLKDGGSQEFFNIYADELYKISEQTSYTDGFIKYYNLIGIDLRHQGKYAIALNHHLKALELAEKNNRTALLAKIYNSIGIVYRRIDDYSNSLNFHFKALSLAEENKNTEDICESYNSIGLIYINMKLYDKALDYYNKVLEIARNNKDKRVMSIILLNIGEVYEIKGDLENAFTYYTEGLQIQLNINITRGLGTSYDNLGNIYKKKGSYDKALEYYNSAAETHLKLNAMLQYANTLKNLGEIYLINGNIEKANEMLSEALSTAEALSSKRIMLATYQLLSTLEEKKGNLKKALEYSHLHANYFDSVWSEQNSINAAKQQAIYDNKTYQEAIMKLNTENQFHKQMIVRGSRINFALAFFVFFVITVTIFLYRSNKIKQKANKQLKHQSRLVARKNELLVKQKLKIEEINANIIDSLRYAQKIQQALLPSKEKIGLLFEESFITFMPLNIVSGDFYWVSSKGEKTIFSVADCTGHGVPGALMSMLGISYLNELTSNGNTIDTADYLNYLRKQIVTSLSQQGKVSDLKDGMSISLCIYDKQKRTLQFSGAQSSIVVLRYYPESRKYVVQEIKGDKMPVGYYFKSDKFTSQTISVDNVHTVYLFSDGYSDQFGGQEGKRMRKSRLMSLIMENADKPLDKQKRIFEKEFFKWKGENDQTDDVILMGVKLKQNN